MQEYVLIFACNSGAVLLIQKDRPKWQAGRFNLVGGKIEPGETPLEATVRELKEETDLTPTRMPNKLGEMICDNGEVIHCYSVDVYFSHLKPRDGETEKVFWIPWNVVVGDHRLIPNLRIIVPLMMAGVTGWTVHVDGDFTKENAYTLRVSLPLPSSLPVLEEVTQWTCISYG